MQMNARAIFQGPGGWNRESRTSTRGVEGKVREGPASCRAPGPSTALRRGSERCVGRPRLVRWLAMHLHAAHPHSLCLPEKLPVRLLCESCRKSASRDHRAESLHGEHAIDRQARQRGRISGRNLRCGLRKRLLQFVRPAPVSELTATIGDAPDPEMIPAGTPPLPAARHRAFRASTGSDLVSTVIPRRTESSRQISKCSRVCGLMDSSAAMTSNTRSMPPTPASMLRTKRSCPGTSTKPRCSVSPLARGRSRWAKPNVDGDAAPLLFLQPVGVDAGKRLHQRGFAVIDVSGGADNDGFHLGKNQLQE